MLTRIIKIIAISIVIFLIYIALAFVSKEIILTNSAQNGKEFDWIGEYKDVKIKDHYKIVFIITEHGAIADREAGYRILAACNKLGWETHVFENVDKHQEEIIKINPDFIFTNKWKSDIGLRNSSLKYKTYALLAHPTTTYFGNLLTFFPKFKEHKFPEVKLFDGLIISAPHISLFKKYIENKGDKFYGFRGFSSVQYVDYKDIEHSQIVYMGVNWDKKRKSDKFSKIFKSLANKKQAVFYGAKESWENLVGDSYKGYFEGPNGLAVVNLLQQYGISLLLHSNQHIKTSTPSGRIFESAASGALGISDMHPFIIENFGNNLLYIDTSKSAESIISQIENHLIWIKENPDKVKEMTRNAYDLFVQRYTLEQLLINVAHMHEKILIDELSKQ